MSKQLPINVLVTGIVCAVLTMCLVSIIVPMFLPARTSGPCGPSSLCISNLRQLDSAKEQYAFEYGGREDTLLTTSQVAIYSKDMRKVFCPFLVGTNRTFDNSYAINVLTAAPTCKVRGDQGHSLSYAPRHEVRATKMLASKDGGSSPSIAHLEFDVELAEPYTNRMEQMLISLDLSNTGHTPSRMDLSRAMICMQYQERPGFYYGHFAQTNRPVVIPPYSETNLILKTETLGDYGRYSWNANYWATHPPGIYKLSMVYFASTNPTERVSKNNKLVRLE